MQQDENVLLQSMYEEYQSTLRTIAAGYKVPFGDIDDVVQETFIAYFKKYSLKWEPARKKAMLVRILKHKCIDYFRRNSHYEKVSINADGFGDEAWILSTFLLKDTLDGIVEREAYEEIKQEIMDMRPEWRNMALLYFVEERSIEELCELLGIPGTVCRSRIYRTRKHLKKILEDKYEA